MLLLVLQIQITQVENHKAKMEEKEKIIQLVLGTLGLEMFHPAQTFQHLKIQNHGRGNRKEQTGVNQKQKLVLVDQEPIEKLIQRYHSKTNIKGFFL